MTTMYVRVWEYRVAGEDVDAFVAAYGPEGDWAQLFRRGRGYAGTELFRDAEDAAHLVTVDRWVDRDSWRAFLEEWQERYQELDVTLSALSTSQGSLSQP